MHLLIVLVLALQEAEVAQDPSAPADVPVKKHKKKKQDPTQEPPGAARPTPEDLQKKPKRADYDAVFRVGMTLEYNDNIIRLDKRDLRALEDGTNPDKFRVEQPQDWIYAPWGEADVAMSFFGDNGRAGLRVTGYIYQVNSFASHAALSAFIKAKTYSLEYTYEPGIYRREYRNLDTGIYESAFYDDHLFEAAMKVPVWEGVLFRPKGGVEIRDYDSPFRYRTSFAPFIAPRMAFPFLPELQPFVQYDFEYNYALAVGVQPDTSYYQNGGEFGVVSKLSKEWELEVKYRAEYRVYTTSHSAEVDPSHAGRTDFRTRIVAGATWKPMPGISVEATYIHGVSDTSEPGKPDLSNEETSWRRNQYLLGFTYVF
jgi:hypothetical protein